MGTYFAVALSFSGSGGGLGGGGGGRAPASSAGGDVCVYIFGRVPVSGGCIYQLERRICTVLWLLKKSGHFSFVSTYLGTKMPRDILTCQAEGTVTGDNPICQLGGVAGIALCYVTGLVLEEGGGRCLV